MAKLQGSRELRARLRAVGKVWKPIGRKWQDATVEEMRRLTPVRTGRTRKSIKRGRLTQKRAEVKGSYVLNFLSAGTKAHEIPRKSRPKLGKAALAWGGSPPTIFRKKVNHRGYAGKQIRPKAVNHGWEAADVQVELIRLWNSAA